MKKSFSNEIVTFLDDDNFMSLKDVEISQLNYGGLYALKIIDISAFPITFIEELSPAFNSLLYIGKSERTIFERFQEECQGIRHGTFFRGIGALLGFRPDKGSLIGYKNLNNYRFNKANSKAIVSWMNENLSFNALYINQDIRIIEKILIQENYPILNTKYNPKKI